MDGLAFEDDQGGAAARPLLVIGHVGIGRLAVQRTEGGEMRLEDEAVPELDLADAERA